MALLHVMWPPLLTSCHQNYLLLTLTTILLISTQYATCLFLSTTPPAAPTTTILTNSQQQPNVHHLSSRQRHHLPTSTSIILPKNKAPQQFSATLEQDDVSNKIEMSLQSNAVNVDTDIDYWSYGYLTGLGVQRAVNECRNKFKWDRWNCPKSYFEDILKENTNVTVPNNKEVAFVRAIMASGMVLSVQQNCSKSTDQQFFHFREERSSSREQVQRVECIKRGLTASRYFLDDQVPSDAEGRSIILQNFEAGRQAFSHTMKELCKCHGTSGSCTTKTCWKQPANLSKIADYLRKQYKLAAKVVSSTTNSQTTTKSLSQQLSLIEKNKLVFSEPSPDYCYENKQLGINGTLGRYCDKSKKGSCERLCTDCGYKIHTIKTIVKKTCNCKFKFCCVVECVPCQKEEEVHQCVEYS